MIHIHIYIYIDKSIDKRQQGEVFLKKHKKLLLAAFYQLTYQHDSKDFNICNYIYIYIYIYINFALEMEKSYFEDSIRNRFNKPFLYRQNSSILE